MNAIEAKIRELESKLASLTKKEKANKVVARAMSLTQEEAVDFFKALTAVPVTWDEDSKGFRGGFFKTSMDVEKSIIETYFGYDNTEPHGVQLERAKAFARKVLDSKKTASPAYSRCSPPVFGGYVKGLPDYVEKTRLNLEAQIRLTIEEKILAYATGDTVTADKLDRKISQLRTALLQVT